MISYQKRILFCLVITAILVSFISIATVSAEQSQDEFCTQVEKVSYTHQAVRPHFNFYYQLLAEKYAPKHVKVWNEVLKDRDALIKKYKDLKKEGKEVENLHDEAWLKEHSDIHQQFLEAVEKRDDEKLKEIVPRVIEHQKQLNVILKKRLKDIK